MIQVIRGIIENEEDETFVRLLYASRSENDIIFKSVLVSGHVIGTLLYCMH